MPSLRSCRCHQHRTFGLQRTVIRKLKNIKNSCKFGSLHVFPFEHPVDETVLSERSAYSVDDYLAPPLGDCTTSLSSPSLRSCPNYVTPWDVPSPNESFLSLAHSPITLTHPNRERGFSIESLAPSLLSSLDLTNNEIQNTDDAWMLEQSSPRLHAQERGGVASDADVSDMSFDVDKADWRQFHIDWLSTLTPTQHIAHSDRTISTATQELF